MSNPFEKQAKSHGGSTKLIGENVPEIEFECQDGRPLQLIRVDKKSGNFELIKETASVICEYNGNVGFCCLAGKYRGGKSFLLNRILNLKGDGFRVSPTVHACTEGIWIWSKPVFNANDNCHIFFMDTEGLSSVDSDPNRDARLFAMAVILSSYFMFNTCGNIDEETINSLSLITHIVHNLVISQDEPSQEYAQSYYAPKFMLIIRDMLLEIRDVSGRPCTPAQYLESQLTEITNIKHFSESSRKIRESIITFFKFRDCVTMVRPCYDEKDLQNLNKDTSKVRPEFMSEVNRIRQKIYENCGAKQLKGLNMTSRMYVQMCESYCEAINKGGAPNIQSAWDNILENECNMALKEAIKKYDEMYRQKFQEGMNPFSYEDLTKQLNNMRDEAYEIFNNVAYVRDKDENMYDEYYNSMIKHIEKKESDITTTNEKAADAHCEEIIEQEKGKILRDLKRGHYNHNNVHELADAFIKMSENYDNKTVGNNKCDIYLKAYYELQSVSLDRLKENIFAKVQQDNAKRINEVKNASQKGATLDVKLDNQNKLLNLKNKDYKDQADALVRKDKKTQQAKTKLQSLGEEHDNQLDKKAELDKQIKEKTDKESALSLEMELIKKNKKSTFC